MSKPPSPPDGSTFDPSQFFVDDDLRNTAESTAESPPKSSTSSTSRRTIDLNHPPVRLINEINLGR